jgi:hypothetical protein
MEWEARFWTTPNDDHSQRIRSTEWRDVLLENRDKICVRGNIRQLIAKNLGYGVVEVTVAPLEVETWS